MKSLQTFLHPFASHKASFKPVDANRELYQIRKMTVKQGDTIEAAIAPGGGHCMWIRPRQK